MYAGCGQSGYAINHVLCANKPAAGALAWGKPAVNTQCVSTRIVRYEKSRCKGCGVFLRVVGDCGARLHETTCTMRQPGTYPAHKIHPSKAP
jgi:hypothetical protein